MGLLFASLSSIPVLVAILYRLHFSLIFSVMVIFLAGMPWLGVAATAGCLFAWMPHFRYSFRYVSALIGRQRDHKIIAAGDLNVLLGYGEYGSPYAASRSWI